MNESRRCSARISNGSRRCRKAAILGGTVCATHGGSAPQVKRSARQRLDALVEPAIEALSAALRSGDTAAIIRTAIAVLDRTGYGPGSKVEVLDSTPPECLPWPDWCTEDELRTMVEIIERATGAIEAGEPQPGAARRSRPQPSTVLNLRQ